MNDKTRRAVWCNYGCIRQCWNLWTGRIIYTLHYPTFTKNLICLQISSSKFQLQSKYDLQITHQIEQFSVMQQNIMKRHSKNQVIMSSYSRNQQIRIQTTKTAKEKLFGSICRLVKQYSQKLVITLLII